MQAKPVTHATPAARRPILPCAAAWLALTGLAGCAVAQPADRPAGQPGDRPGGTAITIYSSAQPGAVPAALYRPVAGDLSQYYGWEWYQQIPGYAVVKEERTIDIPAGRSQVRFTDVAALIDPTTVTFQSLRDPAGTRVLDQDFQFDLVSSQKLIERYIDQRVVVEVVRGDRMIEETGTLLSSVGGLVLRADDGQVKVLTSYSNIRFAELPGGLITRPTLVWDLTAQAGGEHRTRVTYQTQGITWWADYNLVFSEGADANAGTLDVGAWVSIVNKSGAGYEDARLKLVAGDVQRAEPKAGRGGMFMRAAAAEMADQLGFEEKAFFEYHLYTLGRPTTIPDNSTKQVELFDQARGVPAQKVLVYSGAPMPEYWSVGAPYTDRDLGVQSNTKVDVYLTFKNDQAGGLGVPLPKGRIRVSKLDPADGTLEFIGEDTIDHTPRNETVLVKLGSAFDVVGERRTVDFKVDSARRTMEETVEVQLRNRKEQAVSVLVKENLYRWTNWRITQKTHDFEKIDARTVHFPVRLEPDQTLTLRYTVEYTW